MGWIILAAIAVLVAVLLLVPIALHVRYDGEKTRTWIRVLFFKIPVSDSSKPKKKKKQKAKAKKKKKDSKDVFETITSLCDFACSGLKAGKMLTKHLSFYGVSVFWKIARGDPYETGIAFGSANAVLYPVFGVLANLFRVKFERIEVVPDFTAEKDVYDIMLKAKISPFNLLMAGVAFLFDMMKRGYQRSADKDKPENTNNNTKEGALKNG